jgi:hypothetical protein
MSKTIQYAAIAAVVIGMLGLGYLYYDSTTGITMARAEVISEDYLESLVPSGLVIDEIMEFEHNFYVVYSEEDTGIGAMEMLIDKTTGQLFPEYGPNMMWNLKYGHGGMMTSPGGMMGSFGGMMGGYGGMMGSSSMMGSYGSMMGEYGSMMGGYGSMMNDFSSMMSDFGNMMGDFGSMMKDFSDTMGDQGSMMGSYDDMMEDYDSMMDEYDHMMDYYNNTMHGYYPEDYTGEPITEEEALEIAQEFLDATYPGAEADDPHPFYGYYTIHTTRNGEIFGMLSVNSFTGQVWYHNWHGDYIQSIETH